MANDLLREFGRELKRAHQRAASLPDFGERALERENALAGLINQRMPTRFKASRGYVLMEQDVHPQQIDCVVYDAFNYGTRSNLTGNVLALSKSVAAFMFETLSLTREKFKADVERIEAIKRGIEQDGSPDPLAGAALVAPLGFIVAYAAKDRGEAWDVHQAYQDEFQKRDDGKEGWRYLPDGILLLDAEHFLHPIIQTPDKQVKRVILSNIDLEQIEPGTVLGLLNGPGSEDAADIFAECLRFYLMGFKNHAWDNINKTFSLQVKIEGGIPQLKFKRCIRFNAVSPG